MSTISEIEQAIERFPTPQVDELSQWLEAHRASRANALPVDTWLNLVRGAARPEPYAPLQLSNTCDVVESVS